MTRAKFNSPNQIYKSLNLPYSFREFIVRMKESFGDDFFAQYERDELSYDSIQGAALSKSMTAAQMPVRPVVEDQPKTDTKMAANVVNVLLVGAVIFIGYKVYKKFRP